MESIKTNSVGNHYKDQLINAVFNMFLNNDIEIITEHMLDLMCYTTNPDNAKELKKDDIIDMINTQMSIIHSISKVYQYYTTYYYYLNPINE